MLHPRGAHKGSHLQPWYSVVPGFTLLVLGAPIRGHLIMLVWRQVTLGTTDRRMHQTRGQVTVVGVWFRWTVLYVSAISIILLSYLCAPTRCSSYGDRDCLYHDWFQFLRSMRSEDIFFVAKAFNAQDGSLREIEGSSISCSTLPNR